MNPLFEKTTTALVVIDLQKGIVSMPTQPYGSTQIITNATKLAEAFRKNQLPIFWVRVATSPDGKDQLTPITDVENTWAKNARPADWSELVPELGVEPSDFVITKKQWGAFYDTGLDLQLRRRGIKTIVLCGISTNVGVESTARHAFELAYQQIFVEDAMSARSAEEHAHTLTHTFPRIGRVRATEEVLKELV